MKRAIVVLFAHLLLFAGLLRANGQVNVLTQHNDMSRSGANLNETILTTANVNVNTFGQLFAAPVDGAIYAQPLYVSGLTIGGSVHNVLYVCTENNSVFAIDADSGAQIWQSASLGPPVPTSDLQDTNIQGGVVGITATPVIDMSTNTIYVEARSLESGNYIHRLHALDLITGTEKFNGPTVITASVLGTGYDNVGGTVTFNQQRENCRAGLLLFNGTVYLAYGSLDDINYYHGWILGYQASNIANPTAVFCTTPNGEQGGIWQSGNGISCDGTNLYVMTGNGTADIQTGGTDYGQAFLKLSPSLSVLSWFVPFNFAGLNSEDKDVGTGGPVLLPGNALVMGADKIGALYLLSTASLGGFNAAGDQIVGEIYNLVHTFSSPVYWNSSAGLYTYISGAGLPLNMFQVVNGDFVQTPVSQSTVSAPSGYTTGAVLSLSANGSNPSTGILWATIPGVDGTNNLATGTLYAFNASNLSQTLYSTAMNPARDGFATWAKFCAPTVANGHVYIATDSNVVCAYGLFTEARPPFSPTGLMATPGYTQALLNWTGVVGANTYNVYRGTSSNGENAMPVATGLTTTKYVDSGLTNGVTYYYKVAGVNLGGVGYLSNEASVTPLSSLTGSIFGSVTPTPSLVNLTPLGSSDWAHWGTSNTVMFDHKATGNGQISNYTKFGPGTVVSYSNSAIGFSWLDGTINPTMTDTTTGVYTPGLDSGISFTVPADTATRVVRVYLGTDFATGTLTATLSDSSALPYTTTIAALQAWNNQVVTLTYRAGFPGQTLTISFEATSVLVSNGSVGLQSAALEVIAPPPLGPLLGGPLSASGLP